MLSMHDSRVYVSLPTTIRYENNVSRSKTYKTTAILDGTAPHGTHSSVNDVSSPIFASSKDQASPRCRQKRKEGVDESKSRPSTRAAVTSTIVLM